MLICVDGGEMDPGIKFFTATFQHPAAEPRNGALRSMQRLIHQTFKEQGHISNEESREALLFIV